MEFSSVPIIAILCYLIGEIYKFVFKKHKNFYKMIPIIVAITGGLLGVLIHFTNKEMIFNANNVYIALGSGIISGASSTGMNQIFKQLLVKRENNNEAN